MERSSDCEKFGKDCTTENLDGEGAVHLPQEVVHLLAPVLVNRRADGPDKAEDEPELHHRTQVFFVGSIHLQTQKDFSHLGRLLEDTMSGSVSAFAS